MNDFNTSAVYRNNNFNGLKLFLAIVVIFFHCYELSRQPLLTSLLKYFDGEKAVDAFFIISGYLVYKSYIRSASWKDYLLKRLKRLYPAYFTVVILCAILLSFISAYSLMSYFASADIFKYLGANLIFLNFLHPDLPGVFADNPFTAVNGSLWTIKIEVSYYFLVPLLVYLRQKINIHFLFTVIFIFSGFYLTTMLAWYNDTHNEVYLFLSRQIPGQLGFFVLGSWMSELESKKWFYKFCKWTVLPCIVALFLSIPALLTGVILAIIVFSIARILPLIPGPFRQNDISYGLYIYHFPLIQVMVSFGFMNRYPLSSVLLILVVTTFMAILSWRYIEKPFLSVALKKSTDDVNKIASPLKNVT